MVEAAAEQPGGRVRHLVDQRVDALPSIPLQHEIHVERDLDDPTDAVTGPGHHLTDPRLHAVTQADGEVVGKPPVETVAVQVPIEESQILPLLLRRAATSRA